MRHFTIKSETKPGEMYGQKATIFSSWLEDEHGNRVGEDETRAAFRDLSATGIFVKMRYDDVTGDFPCPHEYRISGLIAAITQEYVLVSDGKENKRIPREHFHNWYEID